MNIIAKIHNSENNNEIELTTNQNSHAISIPSKVTGFGSSVNGGELLFLAMATCYCNDVYREAAKLNIKVKVVEVEVFGEFGSEGKPAKNIYYNAKVTAEANENEIKELMINTDKVAEIQNTIRLGIPVKLNQIEAIPV